ncbi:MAG: hypothetical protein RIR18_2395, partial [Pseudomonadota bacterium]
MKASIKNTDLTHPRLNVELEMGEGV